MPGGQPRSHRLWNDAAMRQASPRRALLRAPEPAVVIVIALALAAAPAFVAIVRHDGGAVGADTPVYVWWAKLVGAEGSSAVSMRPGVPNVVELLATALGISENAAVAGLGCALIAMLGLAGSAAVRAGGAAARATLLGLVLTGCFGAYLAAGHLSNAVFAALFVTSIAFLVEDRGKSRIAVAAILLGAAGLAHPEFSWIAGAILIGSAALAMIARQHREAVTGLVVAGAGISVSVLGLLTASFRAPPFDVPTSLDVFLLQTAQWSRLHSLFLERFWPKVATYAPWLWGPLAAVSLLARRWGTPLRRVLAAWTVVTIAGVLVGLAWQPYPPHRIVAFAYCLPLLAATGTVVVCDRLPRFAKAITAAVIIAAAATSLLIWIEAPRPFADPAAAGAEAIAPDIARSRGLIVVDLTPGTNATGIAVIRTTNLLRAAVPPDRIRDVTVRFPAPVADDTDALALWQDTETRLAAARGSQEITELTMPVAVPTGAPAPVTGLVTAIAVWLGVCAASGCVWCIALGHRGACLVERSVGVGLAALILSASIADALGFRLADRTVAVVVVGSVMALGALAATVTARRARRRGRRGASTTTHMGGRVLPKDRSGTA